MSAKAAHCFTRTWSEYIQSGPCALLCRVILCAFYDCITLSLSHTFGVLELPCIGLQPPAVDAEECER